MSKSILLISERPDDLAFVTTVSQIAKLPVVSVKRPQDGVPLLSAGDASVIFIDVPSEVKYQEFENVIQQSVGLFSDKISANGIHFLRSEDLETAKYLVNSPLFGHLVIRNFDNPQEAGEHYGRIVRATLDATAFGLQKLVKDKAKTQIIKLKLSTQKQDAIEAVKNYLLAAKFQSRMATVIANAVDELLMNAMYDAPVDPMGKPLLASTSRATKIELEGKHSVEMHVAFDGEYVAITAVDLFGSLDKVKLLTHISKTYTQEEYKVRTSVAGAGIGLATVSRSGGSLFFVSENRVRTEVTVFFKRTDNFRDFKDQFRFISTQFYF